MLVGFNYPQYANCDGFTFGPYPHVAPDDTSKLSPLWAASLRANLAQLRELGVSVVRIFILGNGFNYGPAPQLVNGTWRFVQPDFLDDPRYRSDPDGKVRRFEDHYRLMLQLFKEASRDGPPIRVIPSIISFHAILDPLPETPDPPPAKGITLVAEPAARPLTALERRLSADFLTDVSIANALNPGRQTANPRLLRASGRGDIVEEPEKRQRFLDAVVRKIVALSVPFKDQIYAIEVMNEPVWTNAFVKPMSPIIGNRIIGFEALSDFLARACAIIEDAGLPSTVGHRHYADCTTLPTGTIAQFHYYPRTLIRDALMKASPALGSLALGVGVDPFIWQDPDVIPDRDQALAAIRDAQKTARPGWKGTVSEVIVGEFGSEIQPSDQIDAARLHAHGDAWPELRQKDRRPEDIVFERLNLLKEKKYALAAVWPHKGSASDELSEKMGPERWASLRRFTGGRP
jgi:hypothetical protein